jgi:hypothetical protein
MLAIPWTFFSNYWSDKLSANSADTISKFPMQMNPDNTSLGYDKNNPTYVTGAFQNANTSDLSGKRFFFVYKPFNLDVVKAAGFTKIVIPTFSSKKTGVNPFSNYTQTDVDFTLNKFFSQVVKLSKTTSHLQLQAACQRFLESKNITKEEAALVDLHNSLITKRNFDFGADAATLPNPPDDLKILLENIDNSKNALKRFWASTVIVERFLEELDDQIKSIVDPTGVEKNMEKNTSVGVFFNKYKTYFEAYYNQIPKSPTTKKKSSEQRLKSQLDAAVSGSSTNVTDNLAQQERDFNRLQAESQINRISGTGVNQFDHGDFKNTMSILDILRDEQPRPSFEQTIAVEETSGVPTTSENDSDTACGTALAEIPKTTREGIKTALNAKKAQYLKTMFKDLFSLKRLQNDPSFRVLGFFSGFGGINFAQFASLSFDVGDFDATKFKEAMNFSGLKSITDGIEAVIEDLTPLSMGNKYLAQINAAAGIFGAADTAVSTYLAKYGGEFDFGKFLKNVSPDDLSKCPSLATINSELKNDDNTTTEVLDKQKDGLKSILKDFKDKTAGLESLTDKIGNIDSQKNLMDLDVSNSNQIVSNIPSLRQKASTVGLGSNLSDDLINLDISVPYVQTTPNIEI